MVSTETTVQALRQALRISPDNIPLRQHLAETLLESGRLEDAEQQNKRIGNPSAWTLEIRTLSTCLPIQ